MIDPLFDVSGLVILVAGGAGGLGKVLAHALAERGAKVTVADFAEGAATEIAKNLPGKGHSSCALDVRDEASCQAAVSMPAEALGRLDVLLNCVGIFRTAPALELPAKDFEDSLAINLTGAFFLARAAGKVMVGKGGGRIIMLASVSSEVVNPDYAAYASSKAGLSHLIRVLALEWAAHNITVNAIGPAVVPTPLAEEFLKKAGKYDYQMSRIPLGRFCAAEDLVGTTLLLASPAGVFITGQTIYVDGGRTLL
jgi:NAD(P)-dependent dehydrogenase (short-subunit alcohol dehydrogenase family)